MMLPRFIRRLGQHPAVQQRPYVSEFVKFGIVGVSNTVVDFTTYLLLTRLIPFFQVGNHYLIANLLAFSVAVVNSYVWNRRWTFWRRPGRIRDQFPRFVIANIFGLLVNEGTLFLFVSGLHVFDLVAKVIAVLCAMLVNFLFSRFWAFSQRLPNRPTSRILGPPIS